MILPFTYSEKQQLNMICVCDPNEDDNVADAIEVGYDISMAKADIKHIHAASEGDKFNIHYYVDGKDV